MKSIHASSNRSNLGRRIGFIGDGEIFLEAREIYRPSRMHKARVSGRFFDRLNSAETRYHLFGLARSEYANFSSFWRRRSAGGGQSLSLSLSRWEGGKQSSDETVYLDGCATHGGAPVPDVNLAVSLIDAAPETLLREEKFPKELGGKRA